MGGGVRENDVRSLGEYVPLAVMEFELVPGGDGVSLIERVPVGNDENDDDGDTDMDREPDTVREFVDEFRADLVIAAEAVLHDGEADADVHGEAEFDDDCETHCVPEFVIVLDTEGDLDCDSDAVMDMLCDGDVVTVKETVGDIVSVVDSVCVVHMDCVDDIVGEIRSVTVTVDVDEGVRESRGETESVLVAAGESEMVSDVDAVDDIVSEGVTLSDVTQFAPDVTVW